MLPGSVYLSHQFSFHSFCDDWQAPLHRGLLDLPSTKLQVRPEVEANLVISNISAFRHGRHDTESFVQDTAITGSPFDEPMATAIQARLEPTPLQPPVFPSYPNGLQPHPQSWRDATVPLRHAAAGLSEGVGGGLGRLKRELGKVSKSPRARKRDSLIFDEHDAISPVVEESGTERPVATVGLSTGSESTVSTTNPVVANHPDFDEWRETEVADDVAEYEAYETFGLGVVGEIDEDHKSLRSSGSQILQQHPQVASAVHAESQNIPPRPPAKSPTTKRSRRPPPPDY